MDEVINLVADRAHITPDQARIAVQTVTDFLKQKLPAPVASQVDAVMSGGTPNVGDAAKGMGGLFGR
ncbi:MAG TPA: DUF2267 domain-containing protein [Anaerolineae bacterium]